LERIHSKQVPLANYTVEAQRTSDAVGLLFDESVGMY
jgi:hypothetical protein